MKTNQMKKMIMIMSKALRPEIADHPLTRYATKSLSKYIVIGVLCLTFAASASAKLGETVPQLIKRFGKNYTVESVQIGKNYKFRSEKVSVDVVVADNISVGETYFSDHPLTASEEPPNDIVQGVLRTNVPKAKWVEIEAAPYRADYAIRSSDNGYIALLRYRGPQPEDATWTMTVARRENMKVEPREIGRAIPAAVAALPTSAAPSKSAVGDVNESPTQVANIAAASTLAASSNAPEPATAALESAPAATDSHSDAGACLLWAIVALYFLPSIIAKLRQKAEGGNGIAFLNLLLGWTVIGWLFCFVWACTGRTQKDIAREDKQHCELMEALALNKIQQ
jgi:Superinfection immunity protein